MNNKKYHLIDITFIILAIFCFYLIGYAHNMSVELEQQEQLTIKYRVESQNNLEKVNELMVKNFSLQSDINRLEKLARNPFDYIESLKEYNKESYMYSYLSICDMIEDAPERPQDMMNVEEYNMYCGIVEAEIGIGNFDEKCHVSSAIANRYYGSTFPDDWMELFTQDNQFSTYSNGSYKRMEVSQSTELAIAYSLMIEDTAQGCEFFRSGNKETWHDKSENVEFVFEDSKHKFFRLKESEDN